MRKLMFDTYYEVTMSTNCMEAWISFKEVMAKFLGNMKAHNHELIVANMIKFKTHGGLIRLTVHFLHNHLDVFPEKKSESKGNGFIRA